MTALVVTGTGVAVAISYPAATFSNSPGTMEDITVSTDPSLNPESDSDEASTARLQEDFSDPESWVDLQEVETVYTGPEATPGVQVNGEDDLEVHVSEEDLPD